MINKIISRLQLIALSLPNILAAAVWEPGQQPWELIWDRLLLSHDKRHEKSYYYLAKYFPVEPQPNQSGLVSINFKPVSITVREDFLRQPSNSYSFLLMYFDLIYPNLVRFPIPALINEGPYEYKTVSLKPGDVVIDGGANVGMFAFWAAANVGGAGKVYAFEPIVEIQEIISQSKVKNINSDKIVSIEPYALGQTSGELIFGYSPENLEGSSEVSNGQKVSVKEITLDEFVRANNLAKVDFIKMDIEGMERKALAGATETLKKFKPKLSICIYHLPDDLEVLTGIIKAARPDYQIRHNKFKLFAW